MRSTGIDRRTLLAALAGGLVWPFAARPARGGERSALYLSVRNAGGFSFYASGFDPRGRRVLDVPLPARGHSFAVHPHRPLAVVFARRAGTFAVAFDLAGGAVVAFGTPPDRHFYGHGAFARDGLLYATENDFAAGRGVIGVYDSARGFRRVGELPSHGVGPHDVRLLADGETLAVANGGIRTRPDLPRVKLNVPTMAPSLAYLDRRDGRLLDEMRLDPALHRLSIRHLSLDPTGAVAFAMQYEGPRGDAVPLVGMHRPGRPPRLFAGTGKAMQAMDNYCGSVAFDAGGAVLATSSPRGQVIVCWEAATGRPLSLTGVVDGCGIAPARAPRRFLASSGAGGVFTIDADSGARAPLAAAFAGEGHWDNHMVAVNG